jgi:hypothetical protein
MKALLQAYREAEKPIIHIVFIYKADGSNVDLCRTDQVINVIRHNTGLEKRWLPADRQNCLTGVAS